MLKQGTIPTVLQDTNLHGSLNHSGPPLPTWPIANNGLQMNWGQTTSAGNHHQPGTRDFGKDFRILPAIQNMNNNAILEPSNTGELDSIEMGTKLNPGRRIEYLEKSIQFLKAQHQELVTSLHEEVDSLQRKNKELQFCIVMMQQNTQTGKEQDKRRDHLSTKRQITKSTQGAGQSGVIIQQSTNLAVDELSSSRQPEEDGATRSDPAYDGTPRTAETSSQFQGSDKLEELKLLFLEEEIKDLRKALDCERKQNQYLTELLRKAHQDRDVASTAVATAAAAGALSASENLMGKADTRGAGEASESSQASSGGISEAVLPFGATLNPLLVHLPSQPPRPPTLRECQVIARHLQLINNRQAHELNQLKTDLRDVLYSHKWTPDAYLLARAYVADDDAAEASQHPQRSLPRIPMKHSTKKLPDSAYAAQESVTLPPLKTIVGNQAIERQKRTQCLQKTKSAKHLP